MNRSLVTAATEYPVTLAEAKLHLRVSDSYTEEDSLIAKLIASATHQAETFAARSFVTKTWDLRLDLGDTPCGSMSVLVMPAPPLQSVTSITYVDTSGVSQTWGSGNYVVDSKSEPGRVMPAYGQSWPATRDHINVMTVRFVAGYGGAQQVPQPIKQAILLIVGELYERRENAIAGVPINTVPMSAEALLWPFRMLGF